MKLECPQCRHHGIDKGRAMDGRRAYRCQSCGTEWTNGLQGRQRQHSEQRPGNQFHDTGAHPMTTEVEALAELARRMYSEYSGNHPTIHCNRFPTWDELGETGQREWLAKALAATQENRNGR